jgi:ATP-dependent Clp protease ATP-binding subunit ClpX
MKARNAYCSFCRKSYEDVGPLVEGPGDVFICSECVPLCQSIIDREKRLRSEIARAGSSAIEPQAIRASLDELVNGQDDAKGALVDAACRRLEGTGRVLLIGSSRSSQVFLAKALAHALDVPFAAEDRSAIGKTPCAPLDVQPLLHKLLVASDFDVELAQHGIVYLDGVERKEVQEALLRLWQEPFCDAVGGLKLDVRGIPFVCGGTFAELDEVNVERLIAAGARPDWVGCLSAIARVVPLDEESLTRIVNWVDFSHLDVVR